MSRGVSKTKKDFSYKITNISNTDIPVRVFEGGSWNQKLLDLGGFVWSDRLCEGLMDLVSKNIIKIEKIEK